MSLIQLEGVGLKRSGRWLIHDVDFSISQGEILTLIGPNGSGKSTTARIALGIIKPDTGFVRVRSGLRCAYVPQKLYIDWTLPLTVHKFMSLTNKHDKLACEEALHLTGVLHLSEAQIQTLSGGEFQRVLLARAIVRKPDFLVLDEPLQGVDFSGQIELYELIGKIRQSLGCGILLISHDLHFVMVETDMVICLNGHVCCRGNARAVAASDEYRKMFGEKASQILGLYAHDHDHVHMPDGCISYARDDLDTKTRLDS